MEQVLQALIMRPLIWQNHLDTCAAGFQSLHKVPRRTRPLPEKKKKKKQVLVQERRLTGGGV